MSANVIGFVPAQNVFQRSDASWLTARKSIMRSRWKSLCVLAARWVSISRRWRVFSFSMQAPRSSNNRQVASGSPASARVSRSSMASAKGASTGGMGGRVAASGIGSVAPGVAWRLFTEKRDADFFGEFSPLLPVAFATSSSAAAVLADEDAPVWGARSNQR
ncbi:MAG TPA: hypothetical protein P5171_14655 [Xanthomonadaceae bacterium]|nr:hypothetical protein [Xanthomonadaceae bacterium]